MKARSAEGAVRLAALVMVRPFPLGPA